MVSPLTQFRVGVYFAPQGSVSHANIACFSTAGVRGQRIEKYARKISLQRRKQKRANVELLLFSLPRLLSFGGKDPSRDSVPAPIMRASSRLSFLRVFELFPTIGGKFSIWIPGSSISGNRFTKEVGVLRRCQKEIRLFISQQYFVQARCFAPYGNVNGREGQQECDGVGRTTTDEVRNGLFVSLSVGDFGRRRANPHLTLFLQIIVASPASLDV